MKIGVIGAGKVGAACITSIIARGAAHEIVVLDQNDKRARGLITDIQYGTPLCSPVNLTCGDYSDLIGAELVIIAVGINEKAGGAMDRNDPAGRLRLLGANAKIICEIIPKLLYVVPTAILFIVTNPPEPLAELTRNLCGHGSVLSAGTYIDTLRFRFHIGKHLSVHPGNVEATVVGEHGNSRVLLWSSATISNRPIMDLIPKASAANFVSDVEMCVRDANIIIIEGNDASQYGIGMACGRVIEAIARNEHAIFPLGYHIPEFGTTLSIPVILAREGVVRVVMPKMTSEERAAFESSAFRLRSVVEDFKLI